MMKKENLIWLLFLIIWAFWYFLMNGTIGHWGETAYFQCGSFYWSQFMTKPGGWFEYLANFLYQFYPCTFVGALIQTLIPLIIFILCREISKRLGIVRQRLWITSLPFVLVFLLQVGQQMDVAVSLKILFLFLFICGYLQVSAWKWRYALSMILFPLFFLILGIEVNGILYANFVLYEFWKQKNPARWGMIVLWAVLIGVVPVIWRQWVQVMPAEELFVVTTARGYYLWVIYGYMLWLWGIERLKLKGFRHKNWFWAELAFVLLLGGIGAWHFYDRAAEYFYRMDLAAENGEWEEVLHLAKKIQEPTREEFFLINLALANRGELGEHLFDYPVWGIGCLYLPRELIYRTSVLGGELYYRLKIPNEALHWTFQASVAAPQGMDFRTLRRLIELNVMKRDSVLADKYLSILENTVGYASWCKQKRKELTQPAKEIVWPDEARDFFIGGRPFLSDMARLLDAGKSKDMVLDYILCGLLLNKDLGKFCQLITMFREADGQRIPTVYQEALLVAMTIDNQAVIQKNYLVDPEINKRFSDYSALYRTYGKNKEQAKKLMKEFKNTWWYYFHFVESKAMDAQGHMLDGGQGYSL